MKPRLISQTLLLVSAFGPQLAACGGGATKAHVRQVRPAGDVVALAFAPADDGLGLTTTKAISSFKFNLIGGPLCWGDQANPFVTAGKGDLFVRKDRKECTVALTQFTFAEQEGVANPTWITVSNATGLKPSDTVAVAFASADNKQQVTVQNLQALMDITNESHEIHIIARNAEIRNAGLIDRECDLEGLKIRSGFQGTAYKFAAVDFGKDCPFEPTTCTNGVLSSKFTHKACTQRAARDCTTPWNATVRHGSTVPAFQTAFTTVGQSCESVQEDRLCWDGSLAGSYVNQNCENPSFGGTFRVYGDFDNVALDPTACGIANPFNNSCSCPAGYDRKQLNEFFDKNAIFYGHVNPYRTTNNVTLYGCYAHDRPPNSQHGGFFRRRQGDGYCGIQNYYARFSPGVYDAAGSPAGDGCGCPANYYESEVNEFTDDKKIYYGGSSVFGMRMWACVLNDAYAPKQQNFGGFFRYHVGDGACGFGNPEVRNPYNYDQKLCTCPYGQGYSQVQVDEFTDKTETYFCDDKPPGEKNCGWKMIACFK